MLIVVTGASKGIGFEMVKRFSVNKNHTVAAISRNTSSLLKLSANNNLGRIICIKADVTKTTDRKKIAAAIKKTNTPVDVLINNAGLILNKSFNKITEKELQAIYNTNVFAPFMLVQQLLPMFNKEKRCHVVNIGSMGGFQGSAKFGGLSAYSSSKAALAGLSECLAEELKPADIAVNCLAIGAVQTEMLGKAFPNYKAPLLPSQMAAFACDFALNGQTYFNGKIIPVSLSTP